MTGFFAKPADKWLLALCIITIVIAMAMLATMALARWENVAAEWEGASPLERQWFKGVRSPHGVPCCDVADGHRTTFEWRQDDAGGHFWVPIEGAMWMVPTEAVVWNAGNPFDTSVVWYANNGAVSDDDGNLHPLIYIRCFVPIGGV